MVPFDLFDRKWSLLIPLTDLPRFMFPTEFKRTLIEHDENGDIIPLDTKIVPRCVDKSICHLRWRTKKRKGKWVLKSRFCSFHSLKKNKRVKLLCEKRYRTLGNVTATKVPRFVNITKKSDIESVKELLHSSIQNLGAQKKHFAALKIEGKIAVACNFEIKCIRKARDKKRRTFKGSKWCYLHGIATHVSFEGRCLSQIMLNELETWCKARDCSFVFLRRWIRHCCLFSPWIHQSLIKRHVCTRFGQESWLK